MWLYPCSMVSWKSITETGERTTADLSNGVPYYRERGVEHDVINANDFECAFIEIEFIRR